MSWVAKKKKKKLEERVEDWATVSADSNRDLIAYCINMDELLDLQAQRGRTIIFVSHDLDDEVGSRIAIMDGGRIVQSGTPREIFTSPKTEYVADFVAHMNPLGVLTALDTMEEGTAEGDPIDAETPV